MLEKVREGPGEHLVLALGVGHATSSQPAPKQLANRVDKVSSIHHQEIWDVYKVNYKLLPITKIIASSITIFTQLNLF